MAKTPNTGMPTTLAPTRPAKVPPPDIVSTLRAEHNVGSRYGLNGFAGRSSTSPGEMVQSPLAASIKTASEKESNPVLDAIIAKGSAAMSVTPTGDAVTATEGVTGSQLRKIAEGNVPDHPFMKSPNKTGKGIYDFDTLPAKTGNPSADYDARRAAAVKRTV
jgi:hypothetical protein